MLKLIVNPGTDQAWEIPLPPGVTTLGSDPAGGFPIAHETVSPAHCQIHVADGAVAIRDLDSSFGTFVDHEPVRDAPLVFGQTIQLGEVELHFSSDENRAADAAGESAIAIPKRIPAAGPIRVFPVAPSSPIAVSTSTAFCKYHPKTHARWRCPQCRLHYCELCVTIRRGEGGARHLCRACGNECEAVEWQAMPEPEEKGFFARLPGAFSYPFRGNGVILLVAGTVFFAFLQLAQFMASMLGPYGGMIGLFIALFGAGYLFSFAKSIIPTTANGEAAPPDWPDFSDWQEDIVMPLGQLVALVALAFGPAIILKWWKPGSETFADVAYWTAMGLGALLAPMGMLALAMFDSVAALNPVTLVWSILRIPVHYLVAAAAFELVIGCYLTAGTLIGSLLPVPVLPGAISGFLGLYLIVVGMRILGLLYHADKERLGWF